jgi:hypothetical protein
MQVFVSCIVLRFLPTLLFVMNELNLQIAAFLWWPLTQRIHAHSLAVETTTQGRESQQQRRPKDNHENESWSY